MATTYPTISKYLSAIRHPQIAFKNLDPILVAGKPVEKAPNSQGFKDLWIAPGGFACVFKYETFNPKKLWAVRCFLQSTSSVATHYSKVSSRLPNTPCSSYFVECSFLDTGIRVDGNLYPIVKMEWAEGKDLRTFIRDNLNNKNKLDLLAQAWVKLSKDLADNGIAHGDLQHGNITIDDSSGLNLKLIDYDSLYFSVDGNGINDEIKGIPDYQHPLRSQLQKQCLQIDFFPQLVIYLSIMAIAENPQLWQTYNLDNTERLLFSVPDLKNPDLAQVFQVLSQMSPNIVQLANELKKICKLTDFSKIPSLETVLTPPVVKWNPAASRTTSKPQTVQPKTWNPSGGTATNPTQNSSPQTWNPSGSKSQTQNPTPQTVSFRIPNLTTNQQTNTSVQNINTSQNSLTQQTQKGSYSIWVTAIAVVSTVIATTLGGFCYYQYQQLNQIKQQIEKTIENKVLPPKGKKPSLSVYLEDVVNVIEGKNSLISLDLEQLMTRLEKDKSSTDKQLNEVKAQFNEAQKSTDKQLNEVKAQFNEAQKKVSEFEKKNRSLQEERVQLQNKVNEFEKSTYVNFCNETSSKKIDAALVYWDGKGLRSKGWWVLEPGKCTEVNLEKNYRGNLYVYGMNNRDEISWGSGDTSFCVDIVDAFEIQNSDKISCSGSNLKKVTMSELAVSPGTNTWSFND